MLISIDHEVLEKYPNAEIGYLVARVNVKKSDPYVESLKQTLAKKLEEEGINATNFVVHPSISQWRRIYENDFQVKAKLHRSSIEALLKRVVTGKEIWKICSVVDLYNCCSVLSLLPMGGYDLKKVSGDVRIRYAKDGEPFWSLGKKESIATRVNQVVYADDQRIMCWLWNHKDSAETCIDETSKLVLFFIDSFDHNQVQFALNELEKRLENIQCASLEKGVLNKSSPEASLKGIDS